MVPDSSKTVNTCLAFGTFAKSWTTNWTKNMHILALPAHNSFAIMCINENKCIADLL